MTFDEKWKKIFQAPDAELKKWRSYGDDNQEDELLQEAMAEQVVEALYNVPWMKFPLLYKEGPIARCYRPAASSIQQCEYEDDLHLQYIKEGNIQIQVFLPNENRISHGVIVLVSEKGEEQLIQVKVIQDSDEAYVYCGSPDELKEKLLEARSKLGISANDPVEMCLEIYRKGQDE